MPEVGIVMTLRDRISSTMKSIAASGKALSSDFEDLYERVEATENRQTALAKALSKTKTSITQQTDTVKAAQKAWNTLRREKDATAESIADAERAYREESEKLEQLKNNLNEYTEASKDARAETKELYAEWRKVRQDMDASGGSGGGSSPSGGSGDGLLAQLGKAGLYKMVGDVASQWADTLAGSALGDAGGSLFSSALSGAGSGAAIGTMINPGLGTAIGAGLGAVVGLAGGATQVFETQDEAFKSYYGNLYDTAGQSTENMISSGSTIAGSREQTRTAFAQRFGSDEAAEDYLSQVEEMAARTNYSYDEITGYAKLLLNSYSADETFGILQRLSDATAGLGLSSSDVTMMISGLSRMRTTGKATQEYLNYFSERGVDVYAALGQSLGVDKSQVAGLVTDGAVDGAQAAEAILTYINQEFGGLSEKLMGTYDAMVDNLDDVMASLEAQGGEGYNQERIAGIQAQQDAYSGVLGEAVGEINRIAGENKAYLENLSEQYTREALSAVLLGQGTTLYGEDEAAKLAEMGREYAQAAEDYAAGNQEAGLRMEALKEQAEALATAAYESSDQYMALQNVELDQIAAIRENTSALNGWRVSYNQQQELSRGRLGTSLFEERIAVANSASQDYLSGDYDGPAPKYAYGLQRVPYNNFPALLHEGERVLTANEARTMPAGSGGVTIQVGQLSVREEADVDRVAEALYERLLLANMAG